MKNKCPKKDDGKPKREENKLMETDLEQHNREIHENRESWKKKAPLRAAYREFYRAIKKEMAPGRTGLTLEVGSGMGNIKEEIPECITSDLFPNPWLDRKENLYELNFPNGSISHLILFDVWHHLEHPANALAEIGRVLEPNGRVIILEPAMSLAGRFVYGKCHHEPLGFDQKFSATRADLKEPGAVRYFAAQASAERLLVKREVPELLGDWKTESIKRITSFAYWGSGGFRGTQLYPDWAYPIINGFDSVLGSFPSLFAGRLLIVLTKK